MTLSGHFALNSVLSVLRSLRTPKAIDLEFDMDDYDGGMNSHAKRCEKRKNIL